MTTNPPDKSAHVPDLIIFRYEDDHDQPVFMECKIRDGKLVEESLRAFTVLEGDPYRDLGTDQIMFAKADGDGSISISSFSIRHHLGPQLIWRMMPSEINAMLPTLLADIH